MKCQLCYKSKTRQIIADHIAAAIKFNLKKLKCLMH